MAFCPNCGTQINPGFSFCPNCGFKVASFAGASTPAKLPEQVDFIDNYLRIDPSSQTYDSFIKKTVIKGDVISICSAMDSEIIPAIQSGDASAKVVLGVLYEKGFAVEKNLDKAFRCFMDSAEKGNPVAQWIAGLMNMEADSSLVLFWDLDLVRGYRWFSKSAAQGYCAAMVNLGNCYSSGKCVAQNKSEAQNWYRKAADSGFAPAQNKLGRCYCGWENGFKRDYSEALKWFSKAAAQQYAPSQNNLGVCFSYGLGVPKDEAEAVKWYRKAAEQGYSIAQNNLGQDYTDGIGVAENKSEAEKWFRKAAEQGYAAAQSNLGRCYEFGWGVPVDIQKAFEWYQKAADQGDINGQYHLGRYYEGLRINGHRTEVDKSRRDLSQAAKWFRLAAEQGSSQAQYKAGRYCSDNAEAVMWMKKAIEQGNADAMSEMGIWYKYGERGLPENRVKAEELWQKANEIRGH